MTFLFSNVHVVGVMLILQYRVISKPASADTTSTHIISLKNVNSIEHAATTVFLAF